jgi:large subunit ribosomal protein L23
MNAAVKEKKPAKAKAEKKTVSKGGLVEARLYDVIVRPLITEKATIAAEQNKVVFKISPTANKKDVKDAVEAIFGVKVKAVNTINVEGKEKKFRGQIGHRKDFRKAIVTLEPGQNIDVAAGQR